MTPAKALELVGRYARLTKAINGCKKRIGEHLDMCPGLNGKRLEVIYEAAFDGGPEVGLIEGWHRPTDAAIADQDTHLKTWYAKERDDEGRITFGEVVDDECPHCYAAHLVIQARKQLRKQLAAVKGAMTRSVT